MDRDGAEPSRTVSIPGRPPQREQALAAGDRIERYELESRIGAGGMGVVWAARDPDLDRRVAIKLVHHDVALDDAQERLLREGQAMAKLSHPAVVPVFDIGRAGEQLFIVMELVEGSTLRQALRSKRRRWPEIVAMFVRAGRGLAAAHAVGIVHRDFKPDNVLVGREGSVRVVDFGLARVAPRPAGAGAGEETSDFAGTPRYMAPEQRRGEPADARSDQFSFCIALWEALYGQVPLDGDELVRPTAPPHSPVPTWVSRLLARGLARDPAERWPTMTALIDAIERIPRRRRRLVVAAASMLGTSAIVAAVVATRPAAADDCTGFEAELDGVWDATMRTRVSASFQATRAPRLDQTQQRVFSILDERARDWIDARRGACRAATRREATPEVITLRIDCLARQRDELAALTRLLASADEGIVARALTAADDTGRVATCERTASLLASARLPNDPVARVRLETLRHRLAAATLSRKLGRFTDAAADLARLADDATAAGSPALAGQATLQLAIAQSGSAKPEEAERTLHRTLRLAGEARDDVLVARALIHSIYVTGVLRARHDEALALRPLAEAAVARAGRDPVLIYGLHHSVGQLLSYADRPDEAWSELQKALAIEERSPDQTKASLLATLNALGNVAEARGDLAGAKALFERAATTIEDHYGPDAPMVAYPTNNLGNIAYRQGRHEDALALYRRALEVFEANLPPGSSAVMTALENVAMTLETLGKSHDALPLYQHALAQREAANGKEHPSVAATLVNLGTLYAGLDRHAEAQTALERAVSIRRKTFGADHIMLASALTNLGLVLVEAGRPRDGQRHAEEALAIFDRTDRSDHPSALEPLIVLGRAHLETKQPRAAIVVLERANALKAKVAPTLWGRAALLLARALWEANRERPRALSIAREAHAALVAAGPAGEKWAQRAATWLRSHE